METTNINVVVAANRKPISLLGANLGTQYFNAEIRAGILNFEEQKMQISQAGDIDFFLNRTPRRYRMTGHEVLGVSVGEDGTGAPKVYLNKGTDAEVSIPISADMSSVGKVDDDAIGKALHGDKSIIFSDPKKLAAILNQYNNDEIKRLEAIIATCQKCIAQTKSAIEENTKKATTYVSEVISSTPSGIPADTEAAILNGGLVIKD